MSQVLFRDPRLKAGVAHFNDGFYFEAHEVWEELWLELVGEEKNLVQGLIQIAAGYYKLEQGNRSATRKLFEKALVRIEAAGALRKNPPIEDLFHAVQATLLLLNTDAKLKKPWLGLATL